MSTQEAGINVFRERLFPIIFMFLVTAVFIAMVSSIYLATRETVVRNEELYLKRAVLFAAKINIPDSPAEVESTFQNRIEPVTGENTETVNYYRVLESGGAPTGYVIPVEGPGLWGTISAVVGFEEGLNEFTGVDFTANNETPGLGGRITERWFREQFRGKTGPFTLVPEGTEGESDTEFDAITGATITSTSVRNILNETLETAPDIIEGER